MKCYFIGLLYSSVIGFVLGMGFFSFWEKIFLALFTEDKEVIDAGMSRLLIMGCSYFISSLMDCTIAALRGLGKTIIPMILLVLGSCIFRIIWVYTIFGHFKTIRISIPAVPCSWL